MRTARRLAALALATTLSLGACGEHRAPQATGATPQGFAGSLTPRPAGAEEIVARVGAAEIWDVDVARHAGAHGLTPREALDELIALELIAAEAARRGLASDPDVVDARRREAARKLVDDYATRTAEPTSIPDDEVNTFWKRADVQLKLNHGIVRKVHFLRVHVRRGTPDDEVERLRTVAEKVRAAALARPRTASEFEAAGLAAATAEGVALEGGPFSTMADDGAAPPFRDAVFKIAAIGEFSPVTRTPWGWDVILLTDVTPAKVTGYAEAAPMLREKMWPEWRRVSFDRWLEALVAQHKTRTTVDPLAQLPGGLPSVP